jgi:hypothetical protein
MKLHLLKLVITTSLLLSTTLVTANDDDNGFEKSKAYSLIDSSKIKQSSAELQRKDTGVCLTVDTKLEKGAYTGWWFIFNNPDACETPRGIGHARCSSTDIQNPMVGATVMWAAPIIVGDDKKSHTSTCIENFELTHFVGPDGERKGLTDPKNAEIHVDIRYHGPAVYSDAQLFGSQLTSFNGGCETNTQSGFKCTEVQTVIFP